MKSGLFVNFSYNIGTVIPSRRISSFGFHYSFFQAKPKAEDGFYHPNKLPSKKKVHNSLHSLVLFALKMFWDKEVQMQMIDFTKNNTC